MQLDKARAAWLSRGSDLNASARKADGQLVRRDDPAQLSSYQTRRLQTVLRLHILDVLTRSLRYGRSRATPTWRCRRVVRDRL